MPPISRARSDTWRSVDQTGNFSAVVDYLDRAAALYRRGRWARLRSLEVAAGDAVLNVGCLGRDRISMIWFL